MQIELLGHMLVFARVVEAHSFTEAARRLGSSKSAISKQITRLESELGTRLLNRTTRRLSLTDAGSSFYAYCARVVAEAEGAYIGGSVDDANALAGTADKKRDLSMWGFAGKGAFQDEGMTYSLDLGGASGDDTRCFGVYGRADCSLATYDGSPNQLITGFKFNRAYQVDYLLFHDLIGTVTNAWYIKPSVSINAFPWYSQDMLGVDLSVLQAVAQNPLGTPGGTAGSVTNIGTELAARGFLGRRGQAYADVVFAYAVTGSAFNLTEGWYDASTSQTPTNAWKLLGHLVLPF